MNMRILGRTPLEPAFAPDQSAILRASTLALVAYLAALGALMLVLLGDDQRAWNGSLGNSLSLQLPAEISPARLEMSLALLHQTPGIIAARILDSAETARLLEPWLGPAAATDTLPIPRLVEIQTDPGMAIDLADLRQKLASITPDAQLDDYRPRLAAHRDAGTRVAVLIAIGLAATAVLAVVLTIALTNLRLAVHRAVIELLHLLGAEDAAIAWPLQRDALRDGLIGGAVGAVAALVTLFVVGHLLPLAAAGPADWRLWGVGVAVAAVTGLGATSAARLAVLRRLCRMP